MPVVKVQCVALEQTEQLNKKTTEEKRSYSLAGAEMVGVSIGIPNIQCRLIPVPGCSRLIRIRSLNSPMTITYMMYFLDTNILLNN